MEKDGENANDGKEKDAASSSSYDHTTMALRWHYDAATTEGVSGFVYKTTFPEGQSSPARYRPLKKRPL